MNADGLLLYGAELAADELRSFVERVMNSNSDRMKNGGDSVPVCIWGTHGIGKTALVESIAQKNGWQFAYAAPAQFEEMGDLHGLPVVVDGRTHFAEPDWVPTEPGPGILLLDDFNRADDRILRGLMQLLQRQELLSWSLPDDWQIVVTANPEGGDYSVTPLDDAMLTRMLHVSMVFDAKVWAKWATDSAVDSRGISFVLTYPEVVVGARTTPRSLTQFFAQIESIPDLKAEWDLVNALASSAVDAETGAAFMAFVADGLSQLLDPVEILNARRFSSVEKKIAAAASDEHGIRLDRLSTICTRLYLHVSADDYEFSPIHGKNLVSFLTSDSLPNDLRLMLHRDLVRDAVPEIVATMRTKELAELALAGM